MWALDYGVQEDVVGTPGHRHRLRTREGRRAEGGGARVGEASSEGRAVTGKLSRGFSIFSVRETTLFRDPTCRMAGSCRRDVNVTRPRRAPDQLEYLHFSYPQLIPSFFIGSRHASWHNSIRSAANSLRSQVTGLSRCVAFRANRVDIPILGSALAYYRLPTQSVMGHRF